LTTSAGGGGAGWASAVPKDFVRSHAFRDGKPVPMRSNLERRAGAAMGRSLERTIAFRVGPAGETALPNAVPETESQQGDPARLRGVRRADVGIPRHRSASFTSVLRRKLLPARPLV